METENDDQKYLAFEAQGMLANYWPTFADTYGLIVTIKSLNVEEKIYITDVKLDRPRDQVFEAALTIAIEDQAKIEELRKLVTVSHT